MKSFDPASLRLYLVLDPDLCGGAEGMIRTTQEALLGGVTFVQLRAPRWKKRAMAECARALLEVTRARGVPLVIDDHADVAFAVNADGVCISPNDVPGYDKDRYMPDSLKDENGKAYAYRDAAGNYYEYGFGLEG